MRLLIIYFLKNQILPAELHIANTSLSRFFDFVQQLKKLEDKSSKISENIEIFVNKHAYVFFLSKQIVNQNGFTFQL